MGTREDGSAGDQYSDPEEDEMSQEDAYEEDEFEQEYRERRKAYDKLEDLEQLKESIRRVTAAKTKNKQGGQDAAREKHRSNKKGPHV